MLSLPSQPAQAVRPFRQWKTVTADQAAALINPGSTIAVSWLGDSLAAALQATFQQRRTPRDLTVVYGVTQGHGRTHGLNMLAEEGLVRRVIGGQWHPVPRPPSFGAFHPDE